MLETIGAVNEVSLTIYTSKYTDIHCTNITNNPQYFLTKKTKNFLADEQYCSGQDSLHCWVVPMTLFQEDSRTCVQHITCPPFTNQELGN